MGWLRVVRDWWSKVQLLLWSRHLRWRPQPTVGHWQARNSSQLFSKATQLQTWLIQTKKIMESAHTTRTYSQLSPTSTSLLIELKICPPTKQTISIWNIHTLLSITQTKVVTCDPILQAIYSVSHNNKQLLLLKVAPCSHLALGHSFMVQPISSITALWYLAITARGTTLSLIYLVRIQGHPLNHQLQVSHSQLWKHLIRQAVSSKNRHSQYLWNHWWFLKLKK